MSKREYRGSKKKHTLEQSVLSVGFVGDIDHNILHGAIQNTAQIVNGGGFDHCVISHTLQLCVVHVVFMNQPILTDVFSF